MDLIESYFYCNISDNTSVEGLVYLDDIKKFFIKRLEDFTVDHYDAAILSLIVYDRDKLKKMGDTAIKGLFGNLSPESLQQVSDVSYV